MKHLCVSALLTGLGFLSGLAALPAVAAPQAGPKPSSDLPIHISSDAMTYDTDKNIVVFQGNVEVEREDFRLWSAVLTLYLKKADAPGDDARTEPALDTGDLDHIVAEKDVRFTYNTQSGTAQKAIYTVDAGLLELEGNPLVRDGESSITGERIRYYMNENRSEVDGGPQKRVHAVFSSSSSSRGR